MDASLAQNAISLKIFVDHANSDFEKIVSKFPEPRSLAFPSNLTNFVFQLLTPKVINKYIEKKVKLEGITKSENKMTLFFITPGDSKSLNNVCKTFDNIPNYTKVILIIPRYTLICQQIILNYGYTTVHNDLPKYPNSEVSVFDFHADFLPVEDNFFLMPSYRSFLQLQIDHDYSEVYNSGRALAKIQTIFGRIPQVFSIGINAERVKNVMNEMNDTANTLRTATPQIDSLIIIDRIADMVTPFLTPTNVEGLIDNLYGINFGICVPPKGIISEPSITMTDQNDIFKQTRMLSLGKVHERIKEIVLELQASIDALQDKNMSFRKKNEAIIKAAEMRNMIAKFEQQMNIIDATTTNTVEKYPAFNTIITREFSLIQNGQPIVDLAENLVTNWNDWTTALRLLCLQSIAGLTHSKKTVSYIQKELCSEFGLETQPMIIGLEHLRFISLSPFFIKWSSVVKELDIFPEGDDPAKEPLDGYVPPTVRIVQNAVNGRWDRVQRAYDPNIISMSVTGQAPEHIPGEKKRVLVFFVGGVTLAEVGILRMISRLSQGVELIIGATEKLNGIQLIHDLFPATLNSE